MPNYNQLTIIGHAGRDAELKYSAAGKPFGKFSMAVNSGYGERQKTTWVQVTIFGNTAEKVSQYITKGKPLMVVGEMGVDEWEKDGEKRFAVTLAGNQVVLLGGKEDTPAAGGVAVTQSAPSVGPSDDDLDIPF